MDKHKNMEVALATMCYRQLDETRWAKVGYELLIFDTSELEISNFIKPKDEICLFYSERLEEICGKNEVNEIIQRLQSMEYHSLRSQIPCNDSLKLVPPLSQEEILRLLW